MNNILVTGGAGYIGSHTCVELLQNGYKVVVIDNLSNSSIESLRRVKKITNKNIVFYEFDMNNQSSLEKVFIDNKIDAVIHFAGLKAVSESISHPIEYYKTNVLGTIILCDVMRKFNCKKIVFSSSATVYGSPDALPIKEDSRLSAINPYGKSKLIIEEFLDDVYKSDNEWDVVILRYFNPVGAHKSGLIGEDPHGIPNNLMPYISQVAIGKRTKLNIYGGDYDTIDGTGVRDYIHVVDLAKGHVAALRIMTKMNYVLKANLGTGRGYSVLEMVESFKEVSGKDIPYVVVGRRSGDISECYLI